MPQQRFPVQVTTLPDCDDITRFDSSFQLTQFEFPSSLKTHAAT